eukprot:CAMPEP_0197855036 /NCGR_PEP_ID=MMETSP1438-20131217/25844_1 /TAXON_ID=1461541 /ORGANISM="Pterosperma sp., Strain CCMP1384" /LENGTH=560 /DNA_ID=CAMNT_0043470007 /DNA_START=208 /DNA_END=1890 /DNA_ORIENTATION=-
MTSAMMVEACRREDGGYTQRLHEMPLWKTKVNRNDPVYVANYKEMQGLVRELEQRIEESQWPGPENAVKKHLKEGCMLARDRVELVLDDDSPFLELCPLAGWGQEGCTSGASYIAGIGLVCGVECVVAASVPTIKGGSFNETTVQKMARTATIAMENNLPMVGLVQSAGADLRAQFKVFHSGGGIFRDIAYLSKKGIPVTTVVFGSSTAGGAYQPGMSDYTVLVKGQAKVYLGGPPLVKMATGEIVDHEELGGADMHSKVSGVSDFLANDEQDALKIARRVVAGLNYKKKTQVPFASRCDGVVEPPEYPAHELLGIASADIRVPYDVREVIARIVDGSRFNEFKPLYGPQLICCFAFVNGFPVGIIANNGVLFIPESNKGTQFIYLCNQSRTPIIFLSNITGFMVGKQYERDGMVKAGSRFINAVTNSQVPAITFVIGASYGAGNYAMCGRAYKPRFIFSWPQSKCSVMGPEQLTGVMDMVNRQSAKNAGKVIDDAKFDAQKEILRKQVEMEGNVYYTSSRLIDDGVIDPRDTRNVLSICLSVIHSQELQEGVLMGVSRM